jgi:hypothetical protein
MENATGWLEWMFGSGPGAGMAMIIFFVGIGGVIIGFAGYLFPNVRYVEERMPDHDKAAADEAEERVKQGEATRPSEPEEQPGEEQDVDPEG